ncbi:Tautomerase enzyme [Pelotomaculum schinkii]|uniref:Tautomerase enzyme n=1 Tax=Pelotomaculum schinkii TaxID=78350 RepID=A0A4Y7R639_9FIRM|nr:MULTISPECIES: 4-oxalocrotonate tautomerase DmpI [Pelotomaculum]TEB04213.1 Tautomerase enzyme [Pelotomaculum schinkii]TEB17761.1 Tautomerase enzyme [Pelotomaculum sp. FP]
MPVITVEAGKMDRNKKALLVKELTQKASEILSIPEQAFVTLIKENDMDNIGTGGRLLSDKMAK